MSYIVLCNIKWFRDCPHCIVFPVIKYYHLTLLSQRSHPKLVKAGGTNIDAERASAKAVKCQNEAKPTRA